MFYLCTIQCTKRFAEDSVSLIRSNEILINATFSTNPSLTSCELRRMEWQFRCHIRELQQSVRTRFRLPWV